MIIHTRKLDDLGKIKLLESIVPRKSKLTLTFFPPPQVNLKIILENTFFAGFSST